LPVAFDSDCSKAAKGDEGLRKCMIGCIIRSKAFI